MRTEKELWEVVLDHQGYFETGLCYWIDKTYYLNKIVWEELLLLEQVLHDDSNYDFGGYWIGKKGEIQPRIDWINNRMKQL